MSHLLHLDSSLRGDASRSRELSAHYADAWRAANPGGTVTYRDLAAEPAPHLTLDAYLALATPEAERSDEQRAAADLSATLAGEVLAADEIVLGMPLYNFGVPSQVKAWFDRLAVPGLDRGDAGFGGRTLTVVAARGGGYAPGTPREGWDHREPWLRHAFEQLGLTDLRVIHAELTLARESPAMTHLDLGGAEDASLAAAHATIDELFGVPHAAAA